MEYDKALYRVYEKTIEDLSASRRNRLSRTASSGANGASSSVTLTSTANRYIEGQSESQSEIDINSESNQDRPSAALFSARSFDQTPSNRYRNGNYVPFFIPTELKINLYDSKHWKLAYQKFRYRLLAVRHFTRNNLQNGLIARNNANSDTSAHQSSNGDDLDIVELSPSPSLGSTSPSVSQYGGLRRRASPRRNAPELIPDMEHAGTSHDLTNDQERQQNNPNSSAESESESVSLLLSTSPSNDQLSIDRSHASTPNTNNNRLCSGFIENSLILCMRLAMFLAFLHLIILFILHTTYVGPRINITNLTHRGSESIGRVSPMTCLERALSTRPAKERSTFHQSAKQLLGDDELLQINIIDDECVDGGCSKVRGLNERKSKEELREIVLSGKYSGTDYVSEEEAKEWHYGSSQYWRSPNYRFATDKAILDLSDDMLYHYDVSIVNVTLTTRCLATGSDEGSSNKLARFLSYYYGYDTAVVNQLMFGIKNYDGNFRNGYLWNLHSAEQFSYSQDVIDFHVESLNNRYLRTTTKLGMLFLSFVCYFFTSSVTAITVRVLTSSGVLILFPFFSVLQIFGVDIDERVLDYAHPWLGTTRRHIGRRASYSFNHFVYSHLGKLILGYSMYEACQLAWVDFFYDRGTGVELPLWSFASLLVIEYYSLIYVRSASSAYFFPRYVAMLFITVHMYFYSTPCAFSRLALVPYFLLIVHAMIFTLLSLEVPAVASGAISAECPREVYVKLSWSEWTSNLPSEWTIFHPLNARYIPLHDRSHDDDDEHF